MSHGSNSDRVEEALGKVVKLLEAALKANLLPGRFGKLSLTIHVADGVVSHVTRNLEESYK